MTKLLDKPLKAFTIYAFVILSLSIPAYYWVVETVWQKELDEHNLIIKERIVSQLQNLPLTQAQFDSVTHIWNVLQSGTRILPERQHFKKSDSTYLVMRKNKHKKHTEIDRFRGLASHIHFKGKRYSLWIETNVEEADEIVYIISVVSLFFFVLLALGFIFLNRTIAQKAWRPFEKTLGQLKSFDLSATETIDFEKTEIQEFEDLHNTLQKMLYAAISAYKQQKTFIENASHELQTPLAILRSKVDLFYQLPELNEAQLQVLEGVEKPLARVSRINKNLLLLAKIENHQFENVEILDIGGMINDILELLQDYAESKNLAIQVRLEARPDIKGNKFLIETLLYNLLTNAIRYTSEDGEIVIFLDSQQLSVQNTGIISLNPAHIFRRFSVSSSEQVSSGLGLAIAKEICHRYNWKMEYAFDTNKHQFKVCF